MNRTKFSKDYPRTTIEAIISRCENTAFIGYESELGKFVPTLGKVTGRSFTRGTESYLKEDIGWSFYDDYVGGGLLKKFIQKLALEFWTTKLA